MPPKANRYPYIVLEGIDGSGKSSLSWKIAHHLACRGIRRLRTSEPHADKLTPAFASTLGSADARALAYEADRIEFEAEAERVLKIGSLIQDRSFYSTLAYQAPSPMVGHFIRRERRVAPDLILLLDIPATEARQRLLESRGELDGYEQSLAYQERVRWTYRALLASNEKAVLIDASQPPEQVTKEALEKVDTLLKCMGIV